MHRPPGAISKWSHVLSTILELYPISAKTWHTLPQSQTLLNYCTHFFTKSLGWSYPCLLGFCLQRLCCGWNRCSIPATSQVRAQAIPGAFNTGTTCQSYQSMSSRHKSPLLTLFSSQAGLASWVVLKMFNCTFNALPVMVCKHFSQMVLFEVSNAVLFPAEIHTQTFKKCFISEIKRCFVTVEWLR